MGEAISNYDQWVAEFSGIKKSSYDLWIAIRREFDEQGWPMTVRQMFYRMSSAGIVPKTEGGYRKVQYALTRMRKSDAVPYGWIADSTRWVRKPRTYNGLGEALGQMHAYYRRRLWSEQPVYVEIWLEKDALAGVIHNITMEFDVPLYVTRGYPSLSYLHEAAESLNAIDKPKFIYHFGDFDASGQDAARSINEGLKDFGAKFDFIQYAVTEAQISDMGLQTRPAKKKDPRAKKHGNIAVELDAIPPATLRQMVRECIEKHIDQERFRDTKIIEQHEKQAIQGLMNDFSTRSKKEGNQ